MNMFRATVRWDGFSGAPGYTNLHFSGTGTPTGTDLSDTSAKVRTFFDAFKTYLPNIVTLSFPSSLEEFDTGTGQLVASHSITPAAAVTGTGGSAVFSSAVGACINWKTDLVLNGRRLRGRTFMVPLQSLPSFDGNGTLGVAARVAFESAANALINNASGLPLFVWHRPPPGGGGAASSVVAATVNDKTAILRSRRD